MDLKLHAEDVEAKSHFIQEVISSGTFYFADYTRL